MEVLDYHKLRIFKTVADLKSISKAAHILFISQPTVTLQIKKIENYLGTTLFRRGKNNLELTEEGKLLYRYAEKILNQYTELEEELKDVKREKFSILNIATSSTIGDFLLPKIVPKFLRENSNIKLNLFVGNSKEVEEAVLSKVFNLGLIEDKIESNKLSVKKFFEDEIVGIASINSSIPKEISLQDLKKYKLITREQGSGTRNVVEKSLGRKLEPVMEVSSSKAIAGLVENSDYISFVSKLVVSEMLSCKVLKEVKVREISIKRNFSIITQKNIRLSKTESTFYHFLTTKIGEELT